MYNYIYIYRIIYIQENFYQKKVSKLFDMYLTCNIRYRKKFVALDITGKTSRTFSHT